MRNFDTRRRELRAELHRRRVKDGDTSKERMAADAVTLDKILMQEFDTLSRESIWSIGAGLTRKAAAAHAQRFKNAGVYNGLGL